MSQQPEQMFAPGNEVALPATAPEGVNGSAEARPQGEAPAVTAKPEVGATNRVPAENLAAPDSEARRRHSEAGRKGANRIHQLIREGKLYEKEHGLKSGRQRLRQLIELGKVYEAEHGMSPALPKKRGRLSRMEQQEVLGTLLQCLLRIARPSFRARLVRLVEELAREEGGQAGY
jgi:hypothetical protein